VAVDLTSWASLDEVPQCKECIMLPVESWLAGVQRFDASTKLFGQDERAHCVYFEARRSAAREATNDNNRQDFHP
jgi:hypothetical protein